MKAKIHLGKTATSRTRRKKVIQQVTDKVSPLGGDLEGAFMDHLLERGYSSKTVVSFCSDVKKFKAWLEKESLEIENISYNDLTAYLQSFGSITQKTKGCYIRGVKQYFNFLIHRGECTGNPAEFIELRGVKRRTLYDILSRQELDSLYYNFRLPDPNGKDKNQNWFKSRVLAGKRNKVILGLMIYQGLDSRDLKLLTLPDVKLREGKIYVPGSRRSAERLLVLESVQIMELMDYLQTTRNELLRLSKKRSEQLFISTGSGERVQNMMVYLLGELRRLNGKVTSARQLKASVIVNWLKRYNLREVQYMAGHRYVSSTEQFLASEMEGMVEDIDKYHPVC
ncbi:MAG: site-specific integrase [Sphingobacteriales bacterium]|nr:site-specific integrase [Sphingobacteriales bacterium]